MLNGLTAIVTGAGKGLGLGISKALAAKGASVALWDVDEAALASASEEVSRSGTVVQVARVNICDEEAILKAVAELMQVSGRIDILVNNAGISGDSSLRKLSAEFWDKVIDTNLKSQMLCAKAVTPHMVAQGFGRIVNISSRAWLGNAGQTAYAVSKGGVVSLTRCLALEFAKRGITVNAIAPGIHDTPLFQTLKPEVQEQLAKSVPMGRVGTIEDVGNAVTFFADPASSYVTGQLLYVCGGRSLAATSV